MASLQCCSVTPFIAAETTEAEGLRMRRYMFLGVGCGEPVFIERPVLDEI